MGYGIDRRTVLRAVPAMVAGGLGSRSLTSTALGAGSPCKYTVEQGSLNEEIVPLSNGNTVEEFYGYNGFFSNTPTNIERDNTSAVFLWDGPKGLSLVVINGKPTSGNFFRWNVKLKFEGLPIEDGKWVIMDDVSDFYSETDTTVKWNWYGKANDGGAFRGGLDGEFEINIEASSYLPSFFGVSNIQFLSGNPADPKRIPLELWREFTIKGSCRIEVDISIKPSDETTPINPNRQGGYIPVAILNNDDIDLDRVDFDSLRFGAPEMVSNGGGATPAHSGHLEDLDGDGDLDAVSHWEDVDDDGDLDLVVHFPAEDTGFTGDESSARLEGRTEDGTPLFGTDTVTFVGSNGGGSGGSKGGGGRPSAPGNGRGNKP